MESFRKEKIVGGWKRGNCKSYQVFSLNAYAVLLSECVILKVKDLGGKLYTMNLVSISLNGEYRVSGRC